MFKRPFNPDQRLRMARSGEIFGVVMQLLGGARMRVQCADGKQRMVRVPGKIRRYIWVREGDVVLVKPWSVEGDEKADIAYRYTRLQVEQLRRRGLLK
ncbi:translation initiation factor eIF-1A [Candidatus Micrarchaeota archaeon CG10_big_fil_rev_8_21_14_0_10_60_32]|nr:MAG: translation initiation factor eIF-1A [Candidatus Micrarchaeota archaeon CG10_big_fil_rev_8_21_14_0_10_60_32]PIY91719.1 MAG: translation initiation factor eIF-1A [Candidatus Micrarchaeota archaeon CG_4_10_14_0_8_um_filter_60_7]